MSIPQVYVDVHVIPLWVGGQIIPLSAPKATFHAQETANKRSARSRLTESALLDVYLPFAFPEELKAMVCKRAFNLSSRGTHQEQ